MGSLDGLKGKIEEFERKGILEQFLQDYQNKSYQYVSTKYKLSQIATYEVKMYLQETYGIKHIPQRFCKNKQQRQK